MEQRNISSLCNLVNNIEFKIKIKQCLVTRLIIVVVRYY